MGENDVQDVRIQHLEECHKVLRTDLAAFQTETRAEMKAINKAVTQMGTKVGLIVAVAMAIVTIALRAWMG
jgi:hypothetical protein